jgi:hypothetical protein
LKQHFIPRDGTAAELERKAADAEEKAANEPEPRATELREEVKLYREWATSLEWKSFAPWYFVPQFRILRDEKALEIDSQRRQLLTVLQRAVAGQPTVYVFKKCNQYRFREH